MAKELSEKEEDRFPGKEKVIAIVGEINDIYPDDIEAVVKASMTRVKKLKEYPQLLDFFVERAVRRIVWSKRHQIAEGIKRAAEVHGKPAKVKVEEIAVYSRKIREYLKCTKN